MSSRSAEQFKRDAVGLVTEGKLGDDLLKRKRFDTLKDAKERIEAWRVHYNLDRPHSALGKQTNELPDIRLPVREIQATLLGYSGFARWTTKGSSECYR